VTGVTWLTNGYPWADDPVGGIFFQTQARAVAALGIPVTVVTPMPAVPWPLGHVRARWRSYLQAPAQAWDTGVQVVRPRYPNVPGQPDWALPDRAVAAAAWRWRRTWDGTAVLHGHYAVTGLAAWRLARRTGRPYFLTFHGDDINTWPGQHPRRRTDLRAAVTGAHAVFAVSGALAQRVREETGVDPIVLPIGCDHASIQQTAIPRAEAREALGLPADRVLVLFVGYLQRVKGVHELASALMELGDPFQGIFVGDGPESGYGVSDEPSQQPLRYVGARHHDEVIRYMAAADVLVLPSHGEGLPTVLVEAGSVGLPVIASTVGGIPELLGEDRGTLLPEISSAAVAGALRSFADHRPEAAAAAGRLRTFVMRKHDVHANARRLADHYRAADAGVATT
jgi:teichuronic acid biosynthesis glycosyltransferase TuaC